MQNEWVNYTTVEEDKMMKPVDTKYPKNGLSKITDVISTLPKDKKFIRKISRLV